MGLDMYLYGVNETLENYSSKYDKNNTSGKTIIIYSIVRTEEMYWRKCYFVDDWIIKNVQNEVNDCDYHIVALDDLRELRDVVKKELKENREKFDDYDIYWLNYTITEINKLENRSDEYDRFEYRNSW